MQHRKIFACVTAAVLAGALACSNSSETPVSPTAATPGVGEAAADGSTLKASAPTAVSPVNNAQPDSLALVATKSTALFGDTVPFSYQFQILSGSTTVCDSGVIGGGSGAQVSWLPANCSLTVDAPYTWQARAVYQAAVGPWSAPATFRGTAGGFIRGNAVFDPLTNGTTVGEIVGSVTFIPGVGVRLNDFGSHIRYRLPQTLLNGEFSLIVTGVATNTEGDKTKLFAMSEGLDDLVTNDRRMSVEKRGDPEGIVAWRFISHLDQIDTEGAEREFVAFDPGQSYLWTATWNGFFNLRVQRGGSTGETIYSKGKPYEGAYDPNPHYAFIGAPQGRSGPTAATVPGMIVRNVWISPNPRPGNLN